MLLRAIHGFEAGGSHLERAFGAAAALGCRFAERRFHEILFGKPVESRVNRANRDIAASAIRNLTAYFHPIGVVSQSHDGEQNQVLEIAVGDVFILHFYIVE